MAAMALPEDATSAGADGFEIRATGGDVDASHPVPARTLEKSLETSPHARVDGSLAAAGVAGAAADLLHHATVAVLVAIRDVGRKDERRGTCGLRVAGSEQ